MRILKDFKSNYAFDTETGRGREIGPDVGILPDSLTLLFCAYEESGKTEVRQGPDKDAAGQA
jgi:hypothetical protein